MPTNSIKFDLELPQKLENNNWFRVTMLVMVAMLFLLPRGKNLNTYGTADEPTYLKAVASFYYLMHEGRYGETYLTPHPGMLNLRSGALAFRLYLPEYVDSPETTYPLPDMIFKQIVEPRWNEQRDDAGVKPPICSWLPICAVRGSVLFWLEGI